MGKVFPCLWLDGNAEEAASFYVTLLPDSHIDKVWRSPAETPSGPADMVLTVDFTLADFIEPDISDDCVVLAGQRLPRLPLTARDQPVPAGNVDNRARAAERPSAVSGHTCGEESGDATGIAWRTSNSTP